jgi:hypothetical protein
MSSIAFRKNWGILYPEIYIPPLLLYRLVNDCLSRINTGFGNKICKPKAPAQVVGAVFQRGIDQLPKRELPIGMLENAPANTELLEVLRLFCWDWAIRPINKPLVGLTGSPLATRPGLPERALTTVETMEYALWATAPRPTGP